MIENTPAYDLCLFIPYENSLSDADFSFLRKEIPSDIQDRWEEDILVYSFPSVLSGSYFNDGKHTVGLSIAVVFLDKESANKIYSDVLIKLNEYISYYNIPGIVFSYNLDKIKDV